MATPTQTKFRQILERLQNKLDGSRAVLFVGPNGIVEHIKADPDIDTGTLAGEYAMLLRIATRTAEDTGAGKLLEHIMVSDKSIVIARHIPPDHFLIVLFRSKDEIGRARYEMKHAAWELSRV